MNASFCWLVPIGPLSHACSRVRSGLGPSRSKVSSRLVGCVRRFRLLFFSLALSGFARSGLGVLVLLFSLFPVLFCVCSRVFQSGSLSFHGHLRFIFIFTSSTLLRQGVCVCTIWIGVMFFYRGGVWHSCLPRAMKLWAWVRRETWPVSCTCRHIYICIVPPLGAYKLQLGGRIVYRCIIPSTSTVILNIYNSPAFRMYLPPPSYMSWILLDDLDVPCPQYLKCIAPPFHTIYSHALGLWGPLGCVGMRWHAPYYWTLLEPPGTYTTL